MIKGIEAVIFDLDGTLVDSMWLWESIDIDYLKRYNIDLPVDLQKEIEGKSFTETAQYFKERFQLQDTVDQIKADWNRMAMDYYTNHVPLKQGVEKFLVHLSQQNIPMGIGTSNSRELVDKVIEKHGIKGYFKSIRTSCEVDKGKPAPDIFLRVAEDLGVRPDKCLVFEDIPNGILAAKAAGMKVCAVFDDFSKSINDEKIALADYYIDHYEVLLTGEE